MVRGYQRKRKPVYSEDELKAAVKAVKDGMKIMTASTKFKVPRGTIFDHVHGRTTKIGAGAPTILSPGEEKEIVATVQALQEIGFGLTKTLVGVVIRDYLKDQPMRPNPFTHGVPGKEWWQLFMKRWSKELSLRKPQHLPTHRAIGTAPFVQSAPTVEGSNGVKSTPDPTCTHVSGSGDNSAITPVADDSADVPISGTQNVKNEIVTIKLVGTYTVKSTITPIRLHLRGYFSDLLKKKVEKPKVKDQKKTRPRFYGECLTADEVYERLRDEEEAKKEKEKEKKEKREKRQKRAKKTATRKGKVKKTSKKKDTSVVSEGGSSADEDDGICEECAGTWQDDSEEARQCWVGCDICPRWYHYYCVAGLTSIPDGFWSCPHCS